VAAKPLGEEKSSAPGRGTTPARAAVIAALGAVVIVLAIVLLNSGGGHKYTLVFQNAGQLVPDNQVLIGGSPVGNVESIELSHNDLAEVHVEVSQQLHEGTTATIRATSLSGVANHYVSISPGPNSNPPLEEGGQLGLSSTTTPVDIDQFFNTFPPSVRRGLQDFIKGNSEIYSGVGTQANSAYKYFGPALNRTNAFIKELNADEALFARFVVSSSRLATTIAGRGQQLSSAISNANTAFSAIASQNTAFNQSLERLAPVFRQSNTTFVNLRAALNDLEPLVNTAKPATKNLAPFLAELRPVLAKFRPFLHNLRLTVSRPGKGNDARDLLTALPVVQERSSKTFPHAETAIAAFQPNLNFFRSYTPDLFNALGKLGAVSGYYDGNGHYVRAATGAQNIFRYNAGALEPLKKSQQFEPFGSEAGVHRRCPGGGAPAAADNSNPYVNPPWSGSGVGRSECDPSDLSPGP
jgi:phospholipid/cholesterol/gamma-HCH transport system substrate-binding protein